MELKFKKGSFSMVISSLITFVFICLGTGGNSWISQELATQYGSRVTEYGLWRSCSSVWNTCQSYTATSSYLLSCRAMTVISSLFSFVTLLLSIVGYFHVRVKPFMITATATCSAITMFIGAVVFVSENVWIMQPNAGYGWTFVISWISITFSLITAIIALIVARLNIE